MSQACPFEELTMTESQRTAFLARVGLAVNAEDFRIIEGMSYALPKIIALLEQEPMTLKKLRHLIFGPKTEKTRDVCPPVTPPATPPSVPKTGKPKGHGRTKASAYTGARREKVSHPHLKANQECPGCKAGKLRRTKTPGIVMRIVGSAPLSATVWELEKLRCDTCGKGAPASGGGAGKVWSQRGRDGSHSALRQRDAPLPVGPVAGKPGSSLPGIDAVGGHETLV
jgi:hypothetical protein